MAQADHFLVIPVSSESFKSFEPGFWVTVQDIYDLLKQFDNNKGFVLGA